MRRKVLLSAFVWRLGKKCGRKMSANRVLPNSAKEANKPKSRSRSLSVNNKLQNAPTVVMQPKNTGVASSDKSLSGSPTKKW